MSLAVQQLNVKKHYATTTLTDAGHINTGVLLADMTYALTNKVAVDLAVPYVVTKYSGAGRMRARTSMTAPITTASPIFAWRCGTT